MNSIDGLMFKAMVTNGYRDLGSHYKKVNELNVFPVPDGDTGNNMLLTVNGGLKALADVNSQSLEKVAEDIGRGMLYSARGNSGVILSQFFAGLAEGLRGLDQANVMQFAQAMESGVKSAYAVVVKPVEGTILTVMREGVEYAYSKATVFLSFSDYFTNLVSKMKISLENTPELLPVLKEAGVIDSGGAGLLYIIEGMAQAVGGRMIEDVTFDFDNRNVASTEVPNAGAFNENSQLDYGYCTEFILQLTNDREGPSKFDLNEFIAFLNKIGSSIVAVRKENVVKIHVHTKTPDIAIAEARKYGEFVTFKMENMALQHNETLIEKSRYIASQVKPAIPLAKVASVSVALSEEMAAQFKDYGVNVVINAGSLNNPSADDFLAAYKQANAEDVIVLPNNDNSILAAKQAAKIFGEDRIHILENSNMAEGYAAISIIDLVDLGLEDNLLRMKKAINNVTTMAFFKAARDTSNNGISIKTGECVGLLNNEISVSSPSFLDSFKDILSKIEGMDDKEVLTFFIGKDLKDEDLEAIKEFINDDYPLLEVYEINGGQAVFSLIAALE